eukprot:5446578-Amphidinium_carterae.1
MNSARPMLNAMGAQSVLGLHMLMSSSMTIMTSFVEKHTSTQTRASCSSGIGIYCTEEQTGLLLKNPLCYTALFSPATTGKEECEERADCVSMWKGAKQMYPFCSGVIARTAHFSMQSALQMTRLRTQRCARRQNTSQRRCRWSWRLAKTM